MSFLMSFLYPIQNKEQKESPPFTWKDQPPHTRYKYLLVVMDTFSRWETFVTQKEGALAVVKTLL